MVFLPVFVLTEGPAVAGGVTATARLAGLAPAVPAALAGVLLLVDDSQGILLVL